MMVISVGNSVCLVVAGCATGLMYILSCEPWATHAAAPPGRKLAAETIAVRLLGSYVMQATRPKLSNKEDPGTLFEEHYDIVGS